MILYEKRRKEISDGLKLGSLFRVEWCNYTKQDCFKGNLKTLNRSSIRVMPDVPVNLSDVQREIGIKILLSNVMSIRIKRERS